jgi:hypothetical protein
VEHLENARKILTEWQQGPRVDGVIRGQVYDSAGNRIYTNDYSAREYGGLDGVAVQLGVEASLFSAEAAYFSMVTELCVLNTDRTRPFWFGSRRRGTMASANEILPESLSEGGWSAAMLHNAFWQAYTQPESEYTIP